MSKGGTTAEKLASLCTDMSWLKEQFKNHLNHHWAVSLCLLGIMATEAVALIIFVIKLHLHQ